MLKVSTPLCGVYSSIGTNFVVGTRYWRNRILKVAKEYKDQDVHFAMGDTDDFGHMLSDSLGIEDASSKDFITATVVDADDKKYKMGGNFR